MYQLMLYPDFALAQFPEGYLNDCTDTFSKSHFFGVGPFGTIYLGQDKEDVRLNYMIQKVPLTPLVTKHDVEAFHHKIQKDLAVRVLYITSLYEVVFVYIYIPPPWNLTSIYHLMF